ncbi:hypothetical protein ACN08P_08135 [Photobacterium leiognathi subsp. mandapamensis]|uniref:hypothetical protein n=1 Tax=Photobacterium leiognathi TaxID=553611 RepID=UPI003AF3659A
MFFDIKNAQIQEQIEKDKKEIWSAIEELKKSLNDSKVSIDNLKQDAPTHFKKIVGTRNKISEIKNKVEDRKK